MPDRDGGISASAKPARLIPFTGAGAEEKKGKWLLGESSGCLKTQVNSDLLIDRKRPRANPLLGVS